MKMMISQRIAKNVKLCRMRQGLSVENLALEAGISTSNLYEIERGNNPTLNSLDCLAKALNVDIHIFFLKDPFNPQNENLLLAQALDEYSQLPEFLQQQVTIIFEAAIRMAASYNSAQKEEKE